MLEIIGLQKSYESFSLEEISFSLNEGNITGFIGNNGAGKTTTLKCILGIVPYNAGRILLSGKEMYQDEISYKEKIGVVFDTGYFYDDLSMASMKKVIACAYSRWEDSKYYHYMEKFGLSEKQKIKTLSKGMKMKFALALALSHDAQILILDEPSSGLDPKTRQLFCDELLEQKNEGKTIFFSTHITSDLDKIGDDIILIENGRILKSSPKEAFIRESKLENPTIEDVMLEIVKESIQS